jgi:HAD superfamily hydrolase (TIGR01450 family)
MQVESLIIVVADPTALREVSEGRNGVVAGAHRRLTIVEMSTVGPDAVQRIASLLRDRASIVDAPVLGSIGEADSGTLTIFAGGSQTDLERVTPLLAALGSIVRVGDLGAGARAKLVANAALFATVTALGEALALADGLGLSREVATAVLAATPLAGQAARRLPAIEAGDYPRRFALTLARKDADLAHHVAIEAGIDTPVLDAARTWLVDAENEGAGDGDYTAVLATILERRARTSVPPPAATLELGAYDGLIVDLDGVVWLGGRAIDGVGAAIERLRANGTRIVFVTNDPQSRRVERAARLTALGIPATADDVLTASAATALFIAGFDQFRGARTVAIGSPALRTELEEVGLQLLDPTEASTADVVVIGGHDGFDYRELCAATTAVAHGAAVFATGRDSAVPSHKGPVPGTGAIVAAVETATGVIATVIGKPAPYLFTTAREQLADCARVAVVGDNLASDIVGAKRAGLDAILVLSGATDEGDLDRARLRPDVVLPSLAAISVA